MNNQILSFWSWVLFSVLVLKSLPGFGQDSVVTIPDTRSISFLSKITNTIYRVDVQFPEDYSKSGKKYPVVYVLDGQWFFPMVCGIYGGLQYDDYMPDCIVVGISWGGTNPNYVQLRNKDFTPTDINKSGEFGNAKKFLSVIEQEIFPLVDSAFRTDMLNKTVLGVSYGGLLATYCLFTNTALFNNYIILSPALTWDNSMLFNLEKQHYTKQTTLPVKIFMAQGEQEAVVEIGVANFNKFTKQLNSRHYKNLQLRTHLFEDAGHSNVVPLGYTRGLQYIFEKPTFTVAPAKLKNFTGWYQKENDKVLITAGNNILILKRRDGTMQTLYPMTEGSFYTKGSRNHFCFTNTSNKITGFCLGDTPGRNAYRKMK